MDCHRSRWSGLLVGCLPSCCFNKSDAYSKSSTYASEEKRLPFVILWRFLRVSGIHSKLPFTKTLWFLRSCGSLGHGEWSQEECQLCRCIFGTLECLPNVHKQGCGKKQLNYYSGSWADWIANFLVAPCSFTQCWIKFLMSVRNWFEYLYGVKGGK